jgi:hypothetical protein
MATAIANLLQLIDSAGFLAETLHSSVAAFAGFAVNQQQG